MTERLDQAPYPELWRRARQAEVGKVILGQSQSDRFRSQS